MKRQNKLYCIYLFVLSIIVNSCDYGSVKNEYYHKLKDKCDIQLAGKKEIPVDENVSISTVYMQYIDNSDILSIYNEPDNAIYLYQYGNCSYNGKKTFAKEGPNGVGIFQGYDYLNKDSVFVYNYNTQFVYLTDSSSNVLWKKRLPIEDLQSFEFIPSFPYLQTNTPMVYLDRKLVFGGLGSAETTAETATNRPVTTIYDFDQDSVFFANNFPEQYQRYNWGGGFFRRAHHAVNKESKQLILSFAQDHYLYVYSLTDKTQHKFYAGSNEIKQIDAYPEKKELYDHIDQDRAARWFHSVPSYRNILYDKYRNLYYRLVTLPETEKSKKFVSATQPILVVVLDKDFNYLGEGMLPDSIDWRFTNSFVTEEGLNMQAYTGNDDLMTFYQIKIEIQE